MNEGARNKLRELIKKYGNDIIFDKDKSRSLILDYCANYKKEYNLFIHALLEDIPKDLASFKNQFPIKFFMQSISRRLIENHDIKEISAYWTTESWAYALGIYLLPTEIISSYHSSSSTINSGNAGYGLNLI